MVACASFNNLELGVPEGARELLRNHDLDVLNLDDFLRPVVHVGLFSVSGVYRISYICLLFDRTKRGSNVEATN